MKIKLLTTLLMFGAANVWAAAGTEGDGTSLITKIFLGFFALIIATQLIPGLILLGSLVKSMFSKPRDATQGKGTHN